jgi:transcription elongation factor Elf1
MKIKKIISQMRRDFTAIFECEHCGKTEEKSGCYDDEYYHRKVIPEMKCKDCNKKASEDYRPLTTKYDDGVQI